MSRWNTVRLGLSDYLLVPAHAVLPNDRASVERLVADALEDPTAREDLASWLGVEVTELEVPEVRARAVASMTSGSWRAIEVEPARESGRPILPTTDPTEPRKPDVR